MGPIHCFLLQFPQIGGSYLSVVIEIYKRRRVFTESRDHLNAIGKFLAGKLKIASEAGEAHKKHIVVQRGNHTSVDEFILISVTTS